MKIQVYGLGALGSNLIIQLMKQFPDFEYFGIDYDKVEDRNIRTQAFFLEHIGMPKVFAISIIAQRYLRKIKYTPINQKIEKIPKLDDTTLYIDCFDNIKSRKLLYDTKCPNMLHIGFSPQFTAEFTWNDKYVIGSNMADNPIDICELNEAIIFIDFIVNLTALEISNYINTGIKNNFIVQNKNKIIKI